MKHRAAESILEVRAQNIAKRTLDSNIMTFNKWKIEGPFIASGRWNREELLSVGAVLHEYSGRYTLGIGSLLEHLGLYGMSSASLDYIPHSSAWEVRVEWLTPQSASTRLLEIPRAVADYLFWMLCAYRRGDDRSKSDNFLDWITHWETLGKKGGETENVRKNAGKEIEFDTKTKLDWG